MNLEATTKRIQTGTRLGEAIILALAAGAALGVLSRWRWDWLGNVGWPWLLAAFLVGSVAGTAWRGGLLGLLTLLVATAAYYVWMFFVDYQMPLDHFVTFGVPRFVKDWAVVAVICGPVFGIAGVIWRSGREVRRVAAVALLMGALAGECLAELLRGYGRGNGVVFLLGLALAALLPWLLLRRHERTTAYTLGGAFAILGIVAFGLLLISVRTLGR